MEITAPQKKKNIIDHLQEWCISNPRSSIFIGVVIVLVGILIEDFFSEHPQGTNIFNRIHYSTVLSHLCIILGEAVIVMFFLHIFIEKSISSSHTAQSIQIIKELVTKSQDGMARSLFATILTEKFPMDIVQAVLDSNFFNTSVLRKNQHITYTFKETLGENVVIEQKVSFDMQYIVGQEETMDYFMPFKLSDTPLSKYEFVQAGYRRISNNGHQNDFVKFNEEDHFHKTASDSENDSYRLKDPISIGKLETIHVYQIIKGIYSIDAKGMVDNFYVNSHSINVTVSFDFPANFKTHVYPTFNEADLPAPTYMGNKKSFENIPFLVTGQGYIFSIKRNTA